MNKFILLFIGLIFITSCINLREPYPNIEYYSLKQEQSFLQNLQQKSHTVLLRRVIVNESFDTPHFLIHLDNSKVQRLFYHRWISDISTLTTDFLMTRLNQSKLLVHGVVGSGSVAVPEYIIEPHLIEMTTKNANNIAMGENFVEIALKVDFIKRLPDNTLEFVFSNVYRQKYIRRQTETKYIADAYSKVFSMAVDNVISDLSNLLK
jgi:ABC-type uncharacterized transport system auxiliary subunit